MVIQREQDKIAIKKRKADAAVLGMVLEPVEEKLEGVSESIGTLIAFFNKVTSGNVEYFDKGLNKGISDSIDKLINAIKGFKQAEQKPFDLAPIISIGQELKRGTDAMIDLIKQSNSGNTSGELFRMITAMVGKQNAFIEKGFSQIDYSSKIDSLIQAVGSKNNIEEINFVYGEGGQIKSAKPTYKK